MKHPLLLFIPVCLGVLLLLPAAASARPTFDQAVDRLIAQGYPQQVEAQVNSFGSSPLGFRLAGTPADNAAAAYLVAEYRKYGISATGEPVPVDVWDFRGASVTVGGREITASIFTESPPTPTEGLSGDLVYVGDGTRQSMDAAGDLSGKIVLIDFMPDWWWVNFPGHEAALRDVKAIVFTTATIDLSYYSNPAALGSNDGEYSVDWPPFVYISRNDGDALKSQLGTAAAADTTVSATVKNDTQITWAKDGGTGYNVVATIPGAAGTDQKVMFASHHDAYFRAGIDNTSSAVADLVIARAMKMSGYKPARDMVFLTTTAEEFGVEDSYYDWCIGSWWFIQTAHPEWAGKIAGLLNMEGAGCGTPQTRLYMNPEMLPWVQSVVAANRGLIGNKPEQINPYVNSYHDNWNFVASGVPTVGFNGKPERWYAPYYHTWYDTQDMIDWSYFGKNAKLMFRFAQDLDRGVGGILPISLKARADDLAANFSAGTLVADGADPATVADLSASLSGLASAGAAFDARKASIPVKRRAAVNAGLLSIEKRVNTAMTALDVWDGSIYPHQQVQWDLEYFNQAIAELAKNNPSAAKATGALDNLGFTWYGPYFSDAVYARELWRHSIDYPKITWGALAHLPIFWNVMPQYRLIQAGDYATASAELQSMRATQIADLNSRLAAMDSALSDATTQLQLLK